MVELLRITITIPALTADQAGEPIMDMYPADGSATNVMIGPRTVPGVLVRKQAKSMTVIHQQISGWLAAA